MNQIQAFNNQDFGEIRTIEEDGKILFVASDVARALGYAKPQNAIAAHCKGALKRGIPTKGGKQEVNVIPEGDLYRLIAHSALPSAQQFESWVFDDVLPTIRKTGAYHANQADKETARRKLEVSAMRAQASLINANTNRAKAAAELLKTATVESYKNALMAIATNTLAGEEIIALPRSNNGVKRHPLGYFCKFVGKPESWAVQFSKELKKLGVEKQDGVNGEYVETIVNGSQRQNFEWYDEFLMPFIKEHFQSKTEN